MAKVNKTALREAATKLRRLRLETVGGDKERPAETVRTALDKGFGGAGSVEAVEYILAAGLRYYFKSVSCAEKAGP